MLPVQPIRQLAAVMFTDIVGYTALMGKESAKALELIRKNRQIQKPLVEKHGGVWLKEMGDGAMAKFNTALDAVNCAVEIQQLAREKFDEKLRIGIHAGDIFIENNDIYGDGVNVAARLEAICDPGGIYISEAIEKAIQGQSDIQVKYIGEIRFKNVDYQVRTYAVQGIGLPVPKIQDDHNAANDHKKPLTISMILIATLVLVMAGQFLYSKYFARGLDEDQTAKSIAVLPFDNITGDEEQEYLCDGLTEELIYRLSMVSGFNKVMPRAAVMRYKGSGMEIPAIAGELGVTNVLSGSFSRSGNMIRVTASLINGSTGEIITPYRFDRPFGDIFAIQSEVANDIVDKMSIDLSTNERNALLTSATNNVEAYNLLLKAGQRRGQVGWDSVSYSLLLQAIELDSSFATAYASLASYWYNQGFRNSNIDRSIIERNVETYLAKALSLNENDPNTILFSANYQLWYKWDFKKAEYYYKKYEQVNPGFLGNTSIMTSLFYAAMGRTSEAVKNAEIALKNGSYSHISYSLMLTYYLDGQIDKSIQLLNEGLKFFGVKPHNVIWAGTRVLNYLGEYDRVIALLSQAFDGSFDNVSPGIFCRLAIAYQGTGDTEQAQLYLDRLLASSEATSVGSPSYYAAMALANKGHLEESFMQLQKAYEKRETEMYWLKVEPFFKPLHNDPRWQQMLDKVGFPK